MQWSIFDRPSARKLRISFQAKGSETPHVEHHCTMCGARVGISARQCDSCGCLFEEETMSKAEYDREIRKAATALSNAWYAQEAGDSADEEMKYVRRATTFISQYFEVPREDVSREIQRKAMEIYEEE